MRYGLMNRTSISLRAEYILSVSVEDNQIILDYGNEQEE